MSEITRYLLQEQMKENVLLLRDNERLLSVANNICDKWVSPDMYAQAKKEIEIVLVR